MKFVLFSLLIVLLFTQSQCFLKHKSTSANQHLAESNNNDTEPAAKPAPVDQNPVVDSYSWACLENQLVLCKAQFSEEDNKVLDSSNAAKIKGALNGIKTTSKFSEVSAKFTSLAKLFDQNLKNEASSCINRVVKTCQDQQVARE